MSEKNVFITGVSSGLGHGLTKILLQQGARVYGCSRRKPEDLMGLGLNHRHLDLADADSGPKALAEWIRGIEHWDLVILNAGKLGKIRDMAETPLEDLRETMEINVWSNKWILDTLFVEAESIRQVIAISSGASQTGSRGWNGYSISKAALNMFTTLYAGERPDTHFTAFAPGLIDSAMQDYLTGLPSEKRFKALEPLKAAKGTPEMPDPETSARQLLEAFPRLLDYESGAYVDIRKM